jgi:hypothetical protein
MEYSVDDASLLDQKLVQIFRVFSRGVFIKFCRVSDMNSVVLSKCAWCLSISYVLHPFWGSRVPHNFLTTTN